MKKLIIITICIIGLTSCNKLTRVTDSEIAAIRDQTKAIEAQTEVLRDISNKLDKVIEK